MRLSSIFRGWDDPKGYIRGKGGRLENNQQLQGATLKSLKHHTALVPLFVILGGGVVFVVSSAIRSTLKTTDINWRKTKDPAEPPEYYKDKQFKMVNPSGVDHANLPDDRKPPNYTE